MKAPGSELVINLACTGVIPTRQMTPHVPLETGEIVAEAAWALDLGVQMMHLHARDENHAHSADPERYAAILKAIRDLPGGREMVLCVSTSGRLDNSFAARSRVLMLEGDAKPDMASLTLSSLNFVQSASINDPRTIRELAGCMLERGIKPELEVFDLGMANMARVLAREGLLEPPFYINVLLGNVAGGQADLLQLAAILAALPEPSIVAIAGLGRFQLAANTFGLLVADGVRTGLEDNIWFDQGRTTLATNRRLVERLLAQAAQLERPLLARRDLRARLGLPARG